MRLTPGFLTFLLISCMGNAAPLSSPEPSPPTLQSSADFLVIGYFPGYRVLKSDWAKSLTDILYFSANLVRMVP